MAKNELLTERYWVDQVAEGARWKDRNSCQGSWEKYRQYFDHEVPNPEDPHFNLVYLIGSALSPSLMFQNPGIVNTPRRPEFQYWAQFFDGIDNWLVDEMEIQDIFEDAILKCYLTNIAGIEINYDWPQDDKVGSEMEFGRVPGTVDRTRKFNQPWVDLIDASRLMLASGTKNERNCRWYGKFVEVPVDTLKEIKGLKNIEATHVPTQVKRSDKPMGELDPDREYTGFWVIRDAEKQNWMWLSTNDKFIMSPRPDPMQVDGLPAHFMTFNKSTKSIWGTPDVKYIESFQLAGDESRYDGWLQSKGANLKCFYDSNLLDEDDIRKFITDKALGCVAVTVPMDKKLGDVIQMIQPHINQERFELQKQYLNDAQLVVGTGTNQLGMHAPGRRTKYETQVVEDNNFLRTNARRNRISKIIGQIFGKVNQLIIRNWKAPIVAKVVGVEGAMHWVKASPMEFKDLAAQLVTKTNVESMRPVSKERRKQEMVEVMNTVANLAGVLPEGGSAILYPVIQNFLSQFDWMQVQNTLPQANTQPVSLNEFQGQQQGLAGGQGLQQMLQGNLGSMQGLIQQLPEAIPAQEG